MIGKAFDVSNWSGPFTAEIETAPGIRRAHTFPSHRPLSAARPMATVLTAPGVLLGDPLTAQSQAECMRDEGYDLAIVGTQNDAITRQQLTSCAGAGMHLETYVYLYFSRDPVAQVEAAIRSFTGFDVRRLWLDCEDAYAENLTEAQTVDFIARAAQACEGKIHSGIYTARWWWDRQTGQSTAFAHFPLWNATADGEGDLTPVDYGGWRGTPAMEQYAFDRLLCGVNVDLNAYHISDPVPPPSGPALDLINSTVVDVGGGVFDVINTVRVR